MGAAGVGSSSSARRLSMKAHSYYSGRPTGVDVLVALLTLFR
jgi:hypothetical protein